MDKKIVLQPGDVLLVTGADGCHISVHYADAVLGQNFVAPESSLVEGTDAAISIVGTPAASSRRLVGMVTVANTTGDAATVLLKLRRSSVDYTLATLSVAGNASAVFPS